MAEAETTITARVSTAIPAGMAVFTREAAGGVMVCAVRTAAEVAGNPEKADMMHLSAADFPGGLEGVRLRLLEGGVGARLVMDAKSPVAQERGALGPRNPLTPIPADAREGKEPCGECHIKPGERCDICGAREAA